MQGSKKIPIIDLNDYITCKICCGYFVDATTIIECLHTFCRSCIVRYLENNKYCPVCDVQVHKTKPLLNIRPDKTIQDIVYKLVPRLFQNEMQRRRDFYDNHPKAKPSSLEQCGEAAYQYLLTPEETICLTLSYHGSNNKPRYLRCPAAVAMGHLKKLIRAKYDLTERHRVDILYNQDCLSSSLTLMDVAYIYLWKRKGPIELTYRIYECVKDPQLNCLQQPIPAAALTNNCENNTSSNNNNWKEVQLRISENGEISVTGIQDSGLDSSLLEIVSSEPKYQNEIMAMLDSKSVAKKEVPGLKYIGKDTPIVSTDTVVSSSESFHLKPLFEEVKPTITSLNSAPLNVSDVVVQGSQTMDIPISIPISSCVSLSSAMTTTVFSTINNSKCSTKSDDTYFPICMNKTDDLLDRNINENDTNKIVVVPVLNNNNTEKNLKRKIEVSAESEPPPKQVKPSILNNSGSLLNLSNNHPLKKHSKMNRNGENVKESSPKVIILENELISSPVIMTKSVTVPAYIKTSCNTSVMDATCLKTGFVNKNLNNMPLSRPDTPISLAKSITTSKPSIIPLKTSTTNCVKSPCYVPKTSYSPIINVPKPTTTITNISTLRMDSKSQVPVSITVTTSVVSSNADTKTVNVNCSQQQQNILNNRVGIKSKPSTPIGYKTLRDPPKSWNSQISKANLIKPNLEQKGSDLKTVRPKFFKMRNNIPRYLGNPASGVKPMYQVHVSPEKEKASQEQLNKIEKSEIKKHSIVKIDPKTLRPISEKAPETSNLSNHSLIVPNNHVTNQVYSTSSLNSFSNSLTHQISQNDLKINTSSVSIFNPLKLQSSPKNDRKSPKSPHSPKMKNTNSPTGNKRDKVNLTFTPPNPFVPRLASPTCPMDPSQFLYPPPYDPRVMAAAYTSLWYGQRMVQAGFSGAAGFPGNPSPTAAAAAALGLDLNQQQRKNFEMIAAAAAAATVAQHTAQLSPKPTPIVSSMCRPPNLLPTSKPQSSKKIAKEPKFEKSLENTVEKLTLSRNKEIGLKNDPNNTLSSIESKENVDQKAKSTPACSSHLPQELSQVNREEKFLLNTSAEVLPQMNSDNRSKRADLSESLLAAKNNIDIHPADASGNSFAVERCSFSQVPSVNGVPCEHQTKNVIDQRQSAGISPGSSSKKNNVISDTPAETSIDNFNKPLVNKDEEKTLGSNSAESKNVNIIIISDTSNSTEIVMEGK